METPDLQAIAPHLQQISFGALAGFAVGYALKKAGKAVALVLGLLFVALQLLAYYGLIDINWGVVQGHVDPLLEPEALGSLWQGLVGLLTFNITFAASFVPGLVVGLRRG